MDHQRLGLLFRAVRRQRGLRQLDVATAAGVSDSFVSLVERGHWGSLSVDSLERLMAVLDIRLDVSARWRGDDADRLLNRAHSMLATSFATWMRSRPGWVVEPEVSFSVYGERGVIDQVAWHAATRHLLVIEIKTEVVDVNELLGTLDRKVRLAKQIARERGWTAEAVSPWLVLRNTRTNRRHAALHAALLRARLPADGRGLRALVAHPAVEAMSGLALWTDSNGRGVGPDPATSRTRIRVPRRATRQSAAAGERAPRASGGRPAADTPDHPA